MLLAEKVESLQDDIAGAQALIDQAQTHHDVNKHLWTEEIAWYFQAEIDRSQFELELSKLAIKMVAGL